MQGTQIRRNEAYYVYAAMTEDAAQRSRWTFCEVVNYNSTRNKKALSISEKTEDFKIENLGISKKNFIYFTINKNKKQVLNFWCISR